MTDFENAAFSVFMVLITRAILSFDLNFYIPIPRTTENMETAHRRDAVNTERFYFRKDPFSHRLPRHSRSGSTTGSGASTPGTSTPPSPVLGPVEDEYALMSIADIINGSAESGFPGLIPLVESYLDSVNVDVETRCLLAEYLHLIRRRADGSLWTNAKWIRDFVAKHEEYKQDSVVSEKICYDLVKAVEGISETEGKGEGVGAEMFGRR